MTDAAHGTRAGHREHTRAPQRTASPTWAPKYDNPGPNPLPHRKGGTSGWPMILPARSLLFVPANRPDRYAKAVAAGADKVIIDLEDSVPAEQRAAARAMIAPALPATPRDRLLVRVNPIADADHAADVAAVPLAAVGGLMVPKLEQVGELQTLARELERRETAARLTLGSTFLVVLIETARGVRDADALMEAAAALGRDCVASFGALDYGVELGTEATGVEPELLYPRVRLTVACRRRRPGAADRLAQHPPARSRPRAGGSAGGAAAGISGQAVRASAAGGGVQRSVHPGAGRGRGGARGGRRLRGRAGRRARRGSPRRPHDRPAGGAPRPAHAHPGAPAGANRAPLGQLLINPATTSHFHSVTIQGHEQQWGTG